jgi:hypothetical protein
MWCVLSLVIREVLDLTVSQLVGKAEVMATALWQSAPGTGVDCNEQRTHSCQG